MLLQKYCLRAVSLLLLTSFLVTACKKKHDPDCVPGTDQGYEVVSHTELDIQDVIGQLTALPDVPEDFDYRDFYFQTAQFAGTAFPHLVAHDVIRYLSTDYKGDPVQLSALMIYPYNFPNFSRVVAPIISFNHATQILKRLAPSKWKSASWKDASDFPEEVLADIMACWYGWIIVMPDYQGMGYDETENHPFCVRERLAVATADLVQAAIRSTSDCQHTYVKWNGQLFLFGFSEGGFVTMSAASELEERDVFINGVVCLDGPYDLSGTMLDVILADTAFPVPYFLPMFLVGYQTVYPDIFPYHQMLVEPYLTDLPQYTNGFYDDRIVNEKMPPDRILKKVFTQSFVDTLQDHNSVAFKTIMTNNSYTDWTPHSKMLLWHCQNDDCVTFGNFLAAKARFTGLGLTGIDYVEWPPLSPDPSKGTIHQRIAPRAFYEGSRWIYNHSRE
jgi:pimeloyl-ACP methyl ester carboxylesterase